MALTKWGLLAHLPSDHCSLLGAFNEGDPLGCLNEQKLTLLTLFTTNLLITGQMALKYTPVCLFKVNLTI